MSPYRSPRALARLAPRTPWWRLACAWCRGVFRRLKEHPADRRVRWARRRFGGDPNAYYWYSVAVAIERLEEQEASLLRLRDALAAGPTQVSPRRPPPPVPLPGPPTSYPG